MKDMESKLFELIGSLMSEGNENEQMLKVCILVVDDLHITIQRYEQLKKGEPLEIYIPGESYLNTLILPTTVYERPDEKAFRQSIRMVEPDLG